VTHCFGVYGVVVDRTPAQQAQLEQARAKSTAWHASDEGRAQHSRQAKKTWENRETITAVCEQCGNKFEATFVNARYCSYRCTRQVLDAQHLYDDQVTCPVCGNEFWRSKYKQTPHTCSRACGGKYRRRQRETAAAADQAWARAQEQ
jgi:hypothetical protein